VVEFTSLDVGDSLTTIDSNLECNSLLFFAVLTKKQKLYIFQVSISSTFYTDFFRQYFVAKKFQKQNTAL